MAAWHPATSLDDWLAEQLQVGFGLSRPAATELVNDRPRRLMPVLDGLDEMDSEPAADRVPGWTPRRAAAAVRSLNEYVDGSGLGPVVVTCRKQRYEQLAADGVVLRNAATVEILPLEGPEIVRYLDPALTADPAVRERWQPFLEHLGVTDNRVLHAALSTPWILHLVVSYAQAGTPPAPLLDVARAPGTARDGIRDVLLDEYVPAVTKLANRRAAERQELKGLLPRSREVVVTETRIIVADSNRPLYDLVTTDSLGAMIDNLRPRPRRFHCGELSFATKVPPQPWVLPYAVVSSHGRPILSSVARRAATCGPHVSALN